MESHIEKMNVSIPKASLTHQPDRDTNEKSGTDPKTPHGGVSTSDQSARGQSALENSATITLNVETVGNDPGQGSRDDLDGSFSVGPAEKTSSDLDTGEQGMEKYLTLSVCGLVAPNRNTDGDVIPENIEEITVIREKTEETTVIPEKTVEDSMIPEKTVENSVIPEKTVENSVIPEQAVENSVIPEKTVENSVIPEKTVENSVIPEKTDGKTVIQENGKENSVIQEKTSGNSDVQINPTIENGDVVEKTSDDEVQREKPFVCDEQKSSSISSCNDKPVGDLCDRKDKTNSDAKPCVKHRPHAKRPATKAVGKLHDPVVELDETVADMDPVKRANEVEGDHRRVSTTSRQLLVNPIAGGQEHNPPTGGVLPNKSPLSFDEVLKENRSSRRKALMSASTAPINREDNRLLAINTAERTSNSPKHCVENTSRGRIRCQTARSHRDQRNTNLRRNNLVSRSLDRSVNTLDSQSSLENREKQRSESVFEQRYTTRELRRALPRKSFFNCHEKAMKDAGFEMDDPATKRKAERLKARLERIANEYKVPVTCESNEKGEISLIENNSNIDIAITDCTDEDGFRDKDDTEISTQVGLENDTNTINESIDALGKRDPTKLSLRPERKKRPGSARQEHIDCKPLVQYLEYVRDNRDEYLNHLHTSLPSSFKSKPTSRLISLGKAFELRHLGGVPRHQIDDVIVMAAKALRPRTSDPAKYTRYDRDKTPNSSSLRAHEAMRQGRPSSEDKRKQEKNSTSSTTHTKDQEEHAKTELEKRKLRAEDWSKTVSTNTLTKAKIQSLRELGADDLELMKWWDAFKQCRYLRDTWPVLDKIVP